MGGINVSRRNVVLTWVSGPSVAHSVTIPSLVDFDGHFQAVTENAGTLDFIGGE
jgi:hypothetical protein